MNENRKFQRFAGALLLVTSVSGCAAPGNNATTDDNLSRLLVAPDTFVLFNCTQLADRAQNTATRIRELQGLMAKAEQGTGGEFVSTIAYRPEYLQLRGEMNELRNAAAAKDCKSVPGNEIPGARSSDRAVR